MAKISLLGRGRRRRKSKGLRGHSSKPCIVKSGAKKGKLKKGWRFNKSGGCSKAKGH